MKPIRIEVSAKVLHWACERNGESWKAYARDFPKLGEWINGKSLPTLGALEKFAKKTRTSLGAFYMDEPPTDELPIADLRTLAGEAPRRPSPDLIDVVRTCQRRQEWYRAYAESAGSEPLSFVGSATVENSPTKVAHEIRTVLELTSEGFVGRNWEAAQADLVARVERAGVLIMRSSMVGNNTTRPLTVNEFRGFALVDAYAPLVFVNTADASAAQMFTIAHELAHVWLGESALSDPDPSSVEKHRTERWCDEVAAEVLVPKKQILLTLQGLGGDALSHTERLSKTFRVSELVVLRRLRDLGQISQTAFNAAYRVRSASFQSKHEAEKKRLKESDGGPSFYVLLPARVSRIFARAVIESARSGETLYRDAFAMLGLKNVASLHKLQESMGDG